jgi:hypothetical protein
VFIRDLELGATRLVSLSSEGIPLSPRLPSASCRITPVRWGLTGPANVVKSYARESRRRIWPRPAQRTPRPPGSAVSRSAVRVGQRGPRAQRSGASRTVGILRLASWQRWLEMVNHCERRGAFAADIHLDTRFGAGHGEIKYVLH